MTEPNDLLDVIARYREDAVRLTRLGQTSQAALITTIMDEVAEAMRDYLDWLSEDEAMLQSGMSRNSLRARFGEWATASPPMARFEGAGRRARRLYRRCIVPRRANRLGAYLEGKAAS